MNFTDILGSIMKQGMAPSSNHRVDKSINQEGGLSDFANSLGLGEKSSGDSWLDNLGKMAGAAVNSGSGGSHNPVVTGGLGALLGALFGGGKGSVKGALGGMALAMLGKLALKALRGGMRGATPLMDSDAQLMAGLRTPENNQEAQAVESLAELTLKAMLNAAKADSTVDREELSQITGQASEDGLSQEEQDFIAQELAKPMDTAGLIRAVPNQQIAAQIYAASLLAIEVDTDVERDYLRELANGLKLDDAVISHLHNAMGVA